jgi:hypothetical protein
MFSVPANLKVKHAECETGVRQLEKLQKTCPQGFAQQVNDLQRISILSPIHNNRDTVFHARETEGSAAECKTYVHRLKTLPKMRTWNQTKNARDMLWFDMFEHAPVTNGFGT